MGSPQYFVRGGEFISHAGQTVLAHQKERVISTDATGHQEGVDVIPTQQVSRLYPSMADEYAVSVPASESPIGSSFVRLLTCRFKSDEQLVAELEAGGADCLTVLFERHGAMVFRIARRILRNDVEAEDTAQQVFLDIFRSVRQFDPEKGSFKSWLLMFVYHRAFNARRHLRSNRFYDSDPIEELLPYETGRPQTPAPAETSILVEEALGLIQPRQRRTIELTYYEGLTATQIPKSQASRSGWCVTTSIADLQDCGCFYASKARPNLR